MNKIKNDNLKIWKDIVIRDPKSKAFTYLFSNLSKVPNEPGFGKKKLFKRISINVTSLRIRHAYNPFYLDKIGVRENLFCNCDHVLPSYQPCVDS